MGLHGHATRVLSVALVIIGVMIVVQTVTGGGGLRSSGLWFGILFVAAGAGRLYAQRGER